MATVFAVIKVPLNSIGGLIGITIASKFQIKSVEHVEATAVLMQPVLSAILPWVLHSLGW